MKYNNIINQINTLKSKLPSEPADDGGEISFDMDNLRSNLNDLKFYFNSGMNSVAAKYNNLLIKMENLKSQCKAWPQKYADKLPAGCQNYDDYNSSYQYSHSNIKNKYDEAVKILQLL